MALESSIVDSVLKYLNKLPECRAEKVKGDSSQHGRADINGCHRGRMFRIEMKSPDHGNTTSSLQDYDLMLWRKAGALTFSASSLQEVKEKIHK